MLAVASQARIRAEHKVALRWYPIFSHLLDTLSQAGFHFLYRAAAAEGEFKWAAAEILFHVPHVDNDFPRFWLQQEGAKSIVEDGHKYKK